MSITDEFLLDLNELLDLLRHIDGLNERKAGTRIVEEGE